MYRNCGRLFSALKDTKYIKLPSSKVQNCTNISHTFGNRLFSASMPLANKKVAVVLSGSGVYDGTEIHEREYSGSELLDVWKNLRIEGCSDATIEIYKELIFDLES